MKRITIIGLLCLSVVKLYGQEEEEYKAKWMWFPSIGIHAALSEALPGNPTDVLLNYNENSGYLQLLSAGWFFHQRWGVTLDMRMIMPMSDPQRAAVFGEWVVANYGDEYYVDEDDLLFEQGSGGITNQYLLSAVYRFESGKFSAYPKLGFGLTHYRTVDMTYNLKEKGSNNVLQITYAATKQRIARMTFSASAIGGYRISRRWILNAELGVNYFSHNNAFVKTIKDLFTGETYTEPLPGFDKNVFSFSGGLGIAYIMSRIRMNSN